MALPLSGGYLRLDDLNEAIRQSSEFAEMNRPFIGHGGLGGGTLMGTTSITTAPSPDAATIILREEKLKLAKELETAKARIVEQEAVIAELVNLLASVKTGETEVEIAEPIPIDIVTDSPTFEHGGKTWFHHTPVAGAECPINGDAEIQVMLREDGGEYRGNHQLAKYYEWGKLGVEYGINGGLEIVAYRVADE